MIFEVEVKNRIATYIPQKDKTVVCQNSEDKIHFTFDDEWNYYKDKVAIFVWGGKYLPVDIVDDYCNVPFLTRTNGFKVGVVSKFNDGNEKQISTTDAIVPSRYSIADFSSRLQGDPSFLYTKYVFGEWLILESFESEKGIEYGINFVCENEENYKEFYGIKAYKDPQKGRTLIYYTAEDFSSYLVAYDEQNGFDDSFRIINFGESAKEVSNHFYDWLNISATNKNLEKYILQAKYYRDQSVLYAQKSEQSSETANKYKEQVEKTANELNSIYGNIDNAINSIIIIQEALIEGGASIPTIYGKYRFNEKARNELGNNATLTLEKTNVKFTASNSDIQFTAIDCTEGQCNYYDADGTEYPVHESGQFDNSGYGDTLDFGERWQIVTKEFSEWVDYYMEKVG